MKKLILIGNKPIENDISSVIDSFDYVFRVNRMMNYGNTGERIDGVFMGIYRDFVEEYKGGPFVDKFKTAGQIFISKSMKRLSSAYFDWTKWITAKQYNNLGIIDYSKYRSHFYNTSVCTSLRVLDYLISEERWTREYEIWICGLDVEDRANILMTGDAWKNTTHSKKEAAEGEERYLKEKLNSGVIKRLGDDGKEIKYCNPS